MCIGAVLCWPTSVIAQMCTIGHASLQASPLYMSFNTKANECSGPCEVEKYLTLTASGEVAISVESTTFHPRDAQSGRTFEVKCPVSYGYQPSESGRCSVFFRPKTFGTFSGDINVTFGYESNELGRYRACLVKKYGGEVIRLSKLVTQMESNGPDFTLLDARAKRIRDIHSTYVAKMNVEKSGAEQFVLNLIAEKNAALDEFRKGLFCSDCKRPKSQVEKEDKITFEEHIEAGRSRGRYVMPAPPGLIKEKEAEYDRKIADAQAKVTEYGERIAVANRNLDRDLSDIETQKTRLRTAFQARVDTLKKQLDFARKQSDEGMENYDRKYKARETTIIQIEGVHRAK